MRAAGLALVLLAACGGEADTGDVPMVEVSGTFRVLDFHDPIDDVIVCAGDPDDCLITDETGGFAWSFPANSDVWLTATHSGMADVLLPLHTTGGDSDPIDVVMQPIAQWDVTLQSGGATWTPGTGALLLTLKQNPTPSALGSPDPGVADVEIDVAAEGVRTRYFGQSGDFIDTLLSHTSQAGQVLSVNIPEGEQTVTIRPDTGSCRPRELGWSGKLPFQADHLTLAVFHCSVD